MEEKAQKVPLGQRLRGAALFVLFSLVLLIPKTLALRQRHRVWMNLRFGAAGVGTALVLASGGAWGWTSGAGVALLLLALAARPARRSKTVDEQARELGALVVLNGGRVEQADGERVDTRLYVSPEHIHVLAGEDRALETIPLAAIRSVRVEETGEGNESRWRLVVERAEEKTVFEYGGYFAEHLARVAETTINNERQAELRVVK